MKKILSMILVCLFLCTPVYAVGDPGTAYCVIDQRTGQVVAQQNAEEQHFPAGVTKLMTYLLILEKLEDGQFSLTDSVTVSENAASKGGTSVFLDAGAAYSVSTLLRAGIISSGNDAVTALAEYAAGSESAFLEQMNTRAAEMGLHCYFADVTGLSPATKASAAELAAVAAELAKHPIYFESCGIWTETFRHASGRETELTSSNKLIKSEQYDGMMTGSSREAGYCLAASMPQGNSRFLCIVLNADSSDLRFELAAEQLSTAAAAYTVQEIVRRDAVVSEAEIPGARQKSTPLYAAQDLAVLIPKQMKLQKRIDLRDGLCAPLKAGECVGRLVVTQEDGREFSVELTVGEEIAEESFRKSLDRILGLWMLRERE